MYTYIYYTLEEKSTSNGEMQARNGTEIDFVITGHFF